MSRQNPLEFSRAQRKNIHYHSHMKHSSKNLTKIVSYIRLNYCGVVFWLAGSFVALTSSLMPHHAVFMGLVGGLGYGLGVACKFDDTTVLYIYRADQSC